jgi:hypothetical protein
LIISAKDGFSESTSDRVGVVVVAEVAGVVLDCWQPTANTASAKKARGISRLRRLKF